LRPRTIEGTVKVSDQELPRWVTIKQVADYYQLDPKTIRRMIAHGKLKARRRGEEDLPSAELPRWVTMKQAADHYQVSSHLIRALIAHEQLDARRIAGTKTIRIDRGSLLQLGRYNVWRP
jgi:hypothetical protein